MLQRTGMAEVSPEFRLRPSLSEQEDVLPIPCMAVSPEFRLRPSLSAGIRGAGEDPVFLVSPEFRLRPSLSARRRRPSSARIAVSPEFRLRPSLSELRSCGMAPVWGGVAGVQTPAFVERPMGERVGTSSAGVAGVQTPAFVERDPPYAMPATYYEGVAGVQTPAFVERLELRHCSLIVAACRRSSDSGLR